MNETRCLALVYVHLLLKKAKRIARRKNVLIVEIPPKESFVIRGICSLVTKRERIKNETWFVKSTYLCADRVCRSDLGIVLDMR